MVRYVIFDMDGTLLDSERFYFEGFQSILSRKGMEFKEENFRHVIGNEDRDTEKYLQGVYGNDFHFTEALAELDRMEEARIRQGDAISVRPGYEHLAAVLRKKNIISAVATSTRRETAKRRLSAAGILKDFAFLLCGDEVRHKKPDPEIYEKAVKLLHADKEHVLVLEDSLHGVRAACRAGIKTLMIPDFVQPTEDILNMLYGVAEDLSCVAAFLD